VPRCVSRFYYERDARGVFPHDYTLDECMAPNGRCDFERWTMKDSAALKGFQRLRQFKEECASNYLSRWFCGMDKVCAMLQHKYIYLMFNKKRCARRRMRCLLAAVSECCSVHLDAASICSAPPRCATATYAARCFWRARNGPWRRATHS
jgi:hypothetical protein